MLAESRVSKYAKRVFAEVQQQRVSGGKKRYAKKQNAGRKGWQKSRVL